MMELMCLVIFNLKLDNDIEMTFYVIEPLILIESLAHLMHHLSYYVG
jgi:hypothetical protein